MADLELDDKYDAVNEARGILSAWMDKKTELDKEELLMTHSGGGSWDSLTPRERSEAEEVEIALKHLRWVIAVMF